MTKILVYEGVRFTSTPPQRCKSPLKSGGFLRLGMITDCAAFANVETIMDACYMRATEAGRKAITAFTFEDDAAEVVKLSPMEARIGPRAAARATGNGAESINLPGLYRRVSPTHGDFREVAIGPAQPKPGCSPEWP